MTWKQRSEWGRWAQSQRLPAADVFRARPMRALADEWSYSQIKERMADHRANGTRQAAWLRIVSPRHAAAVRGVGCVKTGKVHEMTAGRHTSQEFVSFLVDLVARTPWAQQIHAVLDNLSAHKTKDVRCFLSHHPRVQFHFTPAYSSWPNQVELWFAKINAT